MISASLKSHRGNKSRAAKDLGISRRNLIRKVQTYGLEPLPIAAKPKTKR